MEKKQTFEEALKSLESLVKELESGSLTLEDSVTKYNEGIRLAKYCHDRLKEAETVIVKIVQEGEIIDFPKQEE